MVKSTYSSVGLRVKAGGVLSDAFDNLLGVKQGEPLFPLLFLFFISTVERPGRNANWLSISLSSSSDQDNNRSVSILVNRFDRTLTSTIGQ
jgi:hypothetical protein